MQAALDTGLDEPQHARPRCLDDLYVGSTAQCCRAVGAKDIRRPQNSIGMWNVV